MEIKRKYWLTEVTKLATLKCYVNSAKVVQAQQKLIVLKYYL